MAELRLFRSKSEDYYDAPMAAAPLPLRAAIRVIVCGILWAFSKAMWRWRVEGAERLEPGPDGKGSVIICNHTSMAEVVVIAVSIWKTGRRVRPIFKSEFNRTGIVRWAFARVGGIPVDRGSADMKSLRAASHALQRGEDVLIFPEGTRIRRDDQPVEIHGGFALIANMAKARIVPMAVCGFRDVTPAGSHLMRPVRCWLRAGEPLSAADAPAGLGRRERMQWVEDEAMRRVYAIRDDLRREHPGRF